MTKPTNTNKKSNSFSWLIIILAGFILIGYILFPEWWYSFFFLGNILSLKYWAGGFRDILLYLLHNPIFLIAAIIGLVLIIRNKDKIPQINLFQGSKVVIPIVVPILITFVIWSFNYDEYDLSLIHI